MAHSQESLFSRSPASKNQPFRYFVGEASLAIILAFSPGEKEQVSHVSIFQALVRPIPPWVFPKMRGTWRGFVSPFLGALMFTAFLPPP
jgi:hypothetical protein